MKRKLFTLVLAASLAVVSFTGCSKNADKPGNDDKSTKDKLTGTYKMTELILVQGGNTTNVLNQYKSCDRDNLYVLKANMTTQIIDAGEQCSPPSDDTGEWSLPDDHTISMDGQTYHIESIIGNTLKMSVPIEVENGEATLKVTYVKQ